MHQKNPKKPKQQKPLPVCVKRNIEIDSKKNFSYKGSKAIKAPLNSIGYLGNLKNNNV